MTQPDDYDRHHGHAMIACGLWPIMLVFLAPGILEILWLGFLLVVASVAQFIWVPDAYADWRTKRDPD